MNTIGKEFDMLNTLNRKGYFSQVRILVITLEVSKMLCLTELKALRRITILLRTEEPDHL